MDWYLNVLRNYIGFGGRARRKEYWMFILVNFILALVLSIVEKVLGRTVPPASRHGSFRLVVTAAVDPGSGVDRDFNLQLSERDTGRKPLWSGS